MNEASKKIVDKIQKLLSLATSDNEHEAQAAATMAQNLLLRYNLSMDQINSVQDAYEQDEILTGRGRTSTEWKYIASILNEFYFVNIVNSRKRVLKDGKLTKQATYYMFGKPHNVQIAKYVQAFLERSFTELWTAYQIKTNAPTTSKQSFYLGLYKGLQTQLKATVTTFSNETGLVVVKDGELNKFMESQIGKTVQTKQTSSAHDRSAVESGYEQGENLKIAQGLSSRNDSKQYLIK